MATTRTAIMNITMQNKTPSSLLHLLQLVSPALPVGAYAYSQGLESAVEQQWVKDFTGTESWLRGSLSVNLGHLDAPVFLRLYDGWRQQNLEQVDYWNNFLQASRETSELLLEDTQMGEALQRLLKELGVSFAQTWPREKPMCFVTAFALAAQHWNIDYQQALQGLLWSWLENQVAAAIKIVPLGQTQGQQLLIKLMPDIESTTLNAMTIDDDNIGWSLPRLTMASMQHENQYSRLFRS